MAWNARGSAVWMALAALCMSCMVAGGHGAQARGLPGSFNAWTKNVRYSRDGRAMELQLDALSAAGAGSKASYLFGGFGAWIKLPANDSSGTVTTFYMASAAPKHSEFDFEFLGNQSGHPFLLHTNVFVDGVGGREQQIYLGFDPSAAFHYYNFQWNRDVVVFFVDNTPVRMFRNVAGLPYPNSKAMGVSLSIWDGSTWATQGGRVPINWAAGPFVATYQNFRLSGCAVRPGDRNGVTACQKSASAAAQPLGKARIEQMRAVRANQVVYNYCDDRRRYPTAPPECAHNTL